MSLQVEFNDTNNFTGRARIKQKSDLFSISVVEANDSNLLIKIAYNRSAIEKECKISNQISKTYVLDAFIMGEQIRTELSEFRSEEVIQLPSLQQGVSPEFRLKVVSKENDSAGKVIAATSGRIRLKISGGDDASGSRDVGFFHPRISHELGGRIWHVEWSNEEDLSILVNANYFKNWGETPTFAAHIFPEIVRSIATGILLRFEDVTEVDPMSEAGKWMEFIETKLDIPLRGPEAVIDHDSDAIDKLEVVNKIVENFTNMKWRSEGNLLENFLK
jgi:hypothetical protein